MQIPIEVSAINKVTKQMVSQMGMMAHVIILKVRCQGLWDELYIKHMYSKSSWQTRLWNDMRGPWYRTAQDLRSGVPFPNHGALLELRTLVRDWVGLCLFLHGKDC